MIYVLLMTLQSSHREGGIAMHSIEFNDEMAAHDAGRKWQDSLRHQPLGGSYVVVVKP